MNRPTVVAVIIAAALSVFSGSAGGQQPRQPRMPSFVSDSAFRAFMRDVMLERQRRMRRYARMNGLGTAAAPAAADASGPGAQESRDADGITNNQTAGVDEGGIVKLAGNYLVVLRRGRLFTINVADGQIRPTGMSDAFGPGIDPAGAWYDEMLVANGLVVVIGYSYARGGTEVSVFRLGTDGSLTHRDTWHLRSNDYYSSRNYAARLIGTRLVFYSPLYIPWSVEDVNAIIPAMRRWRGQDGLGGFRPIVRPQRIFRPAGLHPADEMALHTVTSCELEAPEVACSATVVMGPPGNVFYVSGSAVYVWMASWRQGEQRQAGSMVARIPLDGGDPSAMGVAGAPVDQFSFLDSGDGYLNVMVRANGAGGWMWDGERASGQAALLRLPLGWMGDGSRNAPASWYRQIPNPGGWTYQNRFVGNYLIYGAGNGWGAQALTDSTLHLVPWRGGEAHAITLSHGVDRIEVMGDDAVIVGTRNSDLHFSGIRLGGRPAVAQRHVMEHASQGELRSHGFFYRRDGDGAGVLGMPVRGGGQPGYRHLVDGSAAILFLRNHGRGFSPLGTLAASAPQSSNDNCRASCVDWYGNARPIFARGRVFALLGYELVEGRIDEARIRETQRASFAPGVVRFAHQP